MTYEQAKAKIFAVGTIPDGYNGHWMDVHFAYDKQTQKTLCVHPYGYFTYHIPCAASMREAYWLLCHHPLSNARMPEPLPMNEWEEY